MLNSREGVPCLMGTKPAGPERTRELPDHQGRGLFLSSSSAVLVVQKVCSSGGHLSPGHLVHSLASRKSSPVSCTVAHDGLVCSCWLNLATWSLKLQGKGREGEETGKRRLYPSRLRLQQQLRDSVAK